MIFVTVGTHEQPFNRLIQKVDELKKDGIIQDDVIIQTGFSTYKPKYCQWSKLIPYQQMVKNVAEARIVITHGGPASFIMPLQIGKTPIVVPRQHQFNEHVNDHQVEFARNVAQKMGTIIPVEDMLRNVPDIPVNDKIFLQRISEYRKHRLWLLKNATKNIGNSEALRSYVIRIIIGMY